MTPPVRAYAPTRSSKPHPRAPPPDPRLKLGPVFVASGVVINNKEGLHNKEGPRVLRVRSVSREEVWASAGVQGALVGGCGCEAD